MLRLQPWEPRRGSAMSLLLAALLTVAAAQNESEALVSTARRLELIILPGRPPPPGLRGLPLRDRRPPPPMPRRPPPPSPPPRPAPMPPHARLALLPPPPPQPPPPRPRPSPPPPFVARRQTARLPSFQESGLDPFARFASRNATWDAYQQTFFGGLLDYGNPSSRRLLGVSATISDYNMKVFYSRWKTHYRCTNNKDFKVPTIDKRYYDKVAFNVRRMGTQLAEITKPTPNWTKFGRCLTTPTPTSICTKIGTQTYNAPAGRRRRLLGGPAGLATPGGRQLASASSLAAVPLTWDWRLLGKVTPAKDQGNECFSGQHHAVVGAIESKYLIATNTTYASNPVDLSEQNLINCVPLPTPSARPCDGGQPLLQALFRTASASTNGSLTTQAVWPYARGPGACVPPTALPAPPLKVQLQGQGSVRLTPWSATALQEAVVEQPVVVGFFATGAFQEYAGGVWPADECNYTNGLDGGGTLLASNMPLNHALLIVGFNIHGMYWIAKNSFGSGMYAWAAKPTGFQAPPPRPPASTLLTFPWPSWNALPIDWCRTAGAGCGAPAAHAFCQLSGLQSVRAVGPISPSPAGQTTYPDTQDECSGLGCETFESLVCSTDAPGSAPITFVSPRFAGRPIDRCTQFGSGCGLPAASAFCQLQGMLGALAVGPVQLSATGETSFPGQLSYLCTGGNCLTFAYVTCSANPSDFPPGLLAPPPPPAVPTAPLTPLSWWRPTRRNPLDSSLLRWQYQQREWVEGRGVIIVPGVQVYFLDYDTAMVQIPILRAAVPDVRVVCSFSAGVYEPFRVEEDKQRRSIQPADWSTTLGSPTGFGGRWVDVRSAGVRAVQRQRLEWMSSIGCDGVDPVDVDLHRVTTGFNITSQDMVKYISFLEAAAHELGMAIGLHNAQDLLISKDLRPDWVISESCFSKLFLGKAPDDCQIYQGWQETKPIFGIQYCDDGAATLQPACYCPRANLRGWSFVVKERTLGVPGISCAAYCRKNACFSGTSVAPCPTTINSVCPALFAVVEAQL